MSDLWLDDESDAEKEEISGYVDLKLVQIVEVVVYEKVIIKLSNIVGGAKLKIGKITIFVSHDNQDMEASANYYYVPVVRF